VLPWEGNFIFKLAEILKYGTETDFYTMTMMVVMNKKKWDSLPDNIKKMIDDTTGMAMSKEAGWIYDVTNTPMKNLCLKKGMQAIQLAPAEKKKLEELTIPLRKEWIQEMRAKGLPGKDVLDASLRYINNN
jgi:TRAP-type C4-dicarboxylate transport system substrate-binding protein